MAAVCIGLILGIPLTDLWIKHYVEKNIPRGEEIPVLKGKILVRHERNEGMALNILERHPKIVRRLSGGMTVVLGLCCLLLIGRKGRGMEKISLSMLIGGSLSNIYDRLVRKYVVDYFGFQTRWKKFTDITFNIADLFIFAGALGIMLAGGTAVGLDTDREKELY